MISINHSSGRSFGGLSHGLTLIEVLVSVSVVAALIAVLVPALSHSRRTAHETACLSKLRQLGVAIAAYAIDHDGFIPYGPKAPPPSATNFYPQTGNVTSLLSLESGAPVGLGLLLHGYLGVIREVLFCPGADQDQDTQAALADVGVSQVEGSYYYRHASVSTLSGPAKRPRVKLDALGTNRRGGAIRCLALDTQLIAPPKMAVFNLRTRTHHQQRLVNALFTDGHASTHLNIDRRYTVDVTVSIYNTLDAILRNFEALDSQ
ncbi:MAG: prepilin-type N-terminal cleavage/methylation domain-containing protein [Planctomycetia bacterium]|nr:prepilin-type N-terminal cleavage/methylation domain-containing protein [Planctomycetia bacterium]MCC7314695.1 prepilin-type N-terminal cleavage/methylation domain-containing protein [Planctomycetota bacterium]